MIKRIISSCIIITLLVLNSACLDQNNDQKAKPYDEDGMLGQTNTNPNLQTSPTHYNYDEDARLVNQALSQVQGILDSRLIINGGRAYIKIRIPGGLTRTEIEQIESEAYDAVSSQLPRYEIHLTSNNSNLRRNQRVKN